MNEKKEMEMFENFCKEYHLDYDFSTVGNGSIYANNETHKAFIVYKYGR